MHPDCEYSYGYGSGSVRTSGILSVETLSMSDTSGSPYSIPHIAFGCSHDSEGSEFSGTDGIVGLGGGELSLISQLGSLVDSKFSYCLVPLQSSAETSPLLFGSAATPKGAKSTPILTNPSINTFYYLSVEGISVGNSVANIPEGTFDLKGDAVPDITYHFGGGADYVIRGQYSFATVRDSNSLCFLTLDMGESSDDVAIFGNLQQQNYHILYDNANHMLSFAPADCASV
ncbi:hypothetical protein KI387_040904 [Taxus chinensis]|uniref:Peptidase A1 domain-containing protein n=1 Tax=Taxus chinensis TaxID=29808 RepID=A0AA38FA92_TAXCH|nr:hypothetical protein KI387_040904 [Taxus chinensis]